MAQEPRSIPPTHAKAKRRRFSTAYKLRILDEVDRADQYGQVAFILRREGLYSSSLSNWRRWRERLEMAGKQSGEPGPKRSELRRENEKLRRENARLQKKLKHANLLIDLQKKLQEMMDEYDEEDAGGNTP